MNIVIDLVNLRRHTPVMRAVLVGLVLILLAPLYDAAPAMAAPGFSYSPSGNLSHLGDAADYGDAVTLSLNSPVVAMAAVPDALGYWLLGGDGGVFSYGSAKFFGSTGSLKLNKPVVAMASSPTSNGYRFVASDGGIFSYGDAGFFGSAGSLRLNKPVVAMATTPSGNGYWLVASDGGIFSYGDAAFFGSAGSIKLNKPIIGMAPTPSGNGYWLVASDGGIFSYGDAAFYGSTGAIALNQPIVSMAATKTGRGYWMAAADGGVFAYGDAKFYGTGGAHGNIVAMARTATGNGYWFASAAGAVVSDNYPTVRYPAPGETITNGNGYAFEYLSGGAPARWDPCLGAISVKLSSHAMPANGDVLVQNVIRELRAITGINFVYGGLTPEPVSLTAVQNNAISIGWLNPNEYSGGEGTDGYTQVQWYYAKRGARMFSADVALLEASAESWYNPNRGVDANYANVVKHELGHALGLWHVGQPSQVMYPTSNPATTDYKGGDLQGLAYLSATSGCVS